MLVSSSLLLIVIDAIQVVHSHWSSHLSTPDRDGIEFNGYRTYTIDVDDNSTWRQSLPHEINALDCGKFQPAKYMKRFVSRNESGKEVPLIAGGYFARLGEFPSFVGIFIELSDGESDMNCGGTIVHPRVVLSAAHCFPGVRRVHISSDLIHPYNWTEKVKRYRVRNVCLDERYNKKTLTHDLAVLIIEDKIKFNANVQPACIPRRPLKKGENGFAVGHGDTETGKLPRKLKALSVSERPCSRGYPPEYSCFKPRRGGGDTCGGDSGGPVYSIRDNKQYLVGITSSGFTPCSTNVVGFGNYLDPYKDRHGLSKLIRECASRGSRRHSL